MSELNKRGLRQRNKRNLPGDEIEDEQMNGYGKPYTKQIYNPSLQLNLDAKSLIKFLNVLNKKFIQYNQETSKLQAKTNIREKSIPNQNTKNGVSSKADANKVAYAKINNVPPTKKKINFTQSNGTNQLMTNNKPMKNEEYLNKIKAMSQESASSMLQLQKSLNKNTTNNSNSTNKIFSASLKNRSEIKNGSIYKQKFQYNYDVKKISISKSGANLALKKSMMHIWIAHFIYKNAITNDADPTLAAKRLKEEVLKTKQLK